MSLLENWFHAKIFPTYFVLLRCEKYSITKTLKNRNIMPAFLV
jgi:hypothetical protein